MEAEAGDGRGRDATFGDGVEADVRAVNAGWSASRADSVQTFLASGAALQLPVLVGTGHGLGEVKEAFVGLERGAVLRHAIALNHGVDLVGLVREYTT